MVNTYCALDFPERVVDEMTYDLLEKTCHLSPVLPRSSTSDQCPNVSLAEYCPRKIVCCDFSGDLIVVCFTSEEAGHEHDA